MKKYLFFATAVFAGMSLKAQVHVASGTNVRVEEKTLFYVDGNMNLDDYASSSAKFLNKGNVEIKGNFTNSDNSGKNFVNTTEPGKYGQLIIIDENGNSVSGKITSQVKFNSKFNFQSIAIPYTNLNAKTFVKQVYANTVSKNTEPTFINYIQNSGYNTDRYRNPLFYWNNDTYTLDNLSGNDNLTNPWRYYAISTFSNMGKLNTGEFTNLIGVPFKNIKEINVNAYIPGPTNKSVNKYGEAYGSYIEDFTKEIPSKWGDFYKIGAAYKNREEYGANIYYFGNPYTSNIDLSKGEGFENVAIYQENSNNYKEDKDIAAASYNVVVASTPAGAGDNTRYVRPFQTFVVKTKGAKSFKFKNEMKTFDIVDKSTNVLFLKKGNNSEKINQLALDLYDDKGNDTGNRVYVVASDIYEAAQKGKGMEIYNLGMNKDDTGIYTLQENSDGSIYSQEKVYINGINSKYVGKPIHLVFQNGHGKYNLKVRLNESLKNNKNVFYLEDKKEKGRILKLTNGEIIPININGTDKDRFVLYWAALPKSVDKNLSVGNTTVIYKDIDTYKVRFDKSMNKADVFIYNISGQLVNVGRGLNTSEDYILPIRGNATVYIIKVVGDKGEVITKKIIK